MAVACLNDVDLHYEIAGEGEPLLLIAGLGNHSGVWAPALPRLVERYRCITFDNRGVGRSSVPVGPYSINQMAEDTAALIDHVGVGPVSALGWSLGGSVLQSMLIRHDALLKRAILLNAFASYSPIQHGWLDALLALRRSGANPLAQIILLMSWGLTIKSLGDHDHAMQMAEVARNDLYPTTVEGFAAQAEGLRHYDSRPHLPGIATPVLVLGGAEDILTPPTQSEEIARLIPRSRLQILPRGGHRMIVEYPTEVIEAVDRFMVLPADG
jgi:pimeloyl-ACP methyl ester carboxylesterase